MSQEVWAYRVSRPDAVDASARRAVRWYEIAHEGIKTFKGARIRQNAPLYPLKQQIYLWLSRKHDVLFDALSKGEILPIDVLDAVVRDFSSCGNLSQLGFLPELICTCSLRSMCLSWPSEL